MNSQKEPFKPAPIWLMLAGWFFIVELPTGIDCCRDFEGWFQHAALSKELIKRNVVTAQEIRSFEIELYAYVLFCVLMGMTYGHTNRKAIAARYARRRKPENIAKFYWEGVTTMATHLFGLLLALFLVTFGLPEACAQQGRKGWFLLRGGLTTSALMLGLLAMKLSLAPVIRGISAVESGDKK